MEIFVDTIKSLAATSGFAGFGAENGWQSIIMILLSFVLFYLAIKKQYEPLLMLPIAFGMLLTNLPGSGLYHAELWNPSTNPYFAPEYVQEGANLLITYTKEVSLDYGRVLHEGGLLDMLYLGVKLGIYPPIIFLGIGAMTDFGPLIANPKSFPARRCRTGRYLLHIPRRMRNQRAGSRRRLLTEAGCFHRYHRRCGRSYCDLPYLQTRA